MADLKELIPLPAKFYRRDTITVAKELLGKVLVKISGKSILSAMITETEAYIGEHDPASHSYKKFTERNRVMYDEGGKVYVYFIYGNYYCFNIVTGNKGDGNAVLIRAAEPLSGIERMKIVRGRIKNIHDLTNGPAKLCMALSIDNRLYGEDVTDKKKIFVSRNPLKSDFTICISKRIGLNTGVDFPYRFFIKDNKYVTRHKFNKEIISEINIIS